MKIQDSELLTKHERLCVAIYSLVRNEYEVLGEYQTSQTPVLMRHQTCGYEWNVRPHHFLRGSRCPRCQGLLRKTPEQFEEDVLRVAGKEYEVKTAYSNALTPVLMKHQLCEHEWWVIPNRFLNGTRCPKCANRNRRLKQRKTQEQFEREIEEKGKGEYQVLSQYEHSFVQVQLKHQPCGHTWWVYPGNFLSGNRCPKCCKYSRNRVLRKSEDVSE